MLISVKMSREESKNIIMGIIKQLDHMLLLRQSFLKKWGQDRRLEEEGNI